MGVAMTKLYHIQHIPRWPGFDSRPGPSTSQQEQHQKARTTMHLFIQSLKIPIEFL